MIGLSQQDIASFRDERLRSVAPSTAARELAILSHVIEVAIRDWGLPTLEKRIETIKAWGGSIRQCSLIGAITITGECALPSEVG